MNAPSAWAVAKRDAPRIAETCWSNLDLLRLREQLMDGTEVAKVDLVLGTFDEVTRDPNIKTD